MKIQGMKPDMKLYTIGFTRKSAETFFIQLKRQGSER